jgi:hypothetical protein
MGYLTASNLRKRFAVSPPYHFAGIIGEATKKLFPQAICLLVVSGSL